MELAIHPRPGSLSEVWVPQARELGIDVRIVDCLRADVLEQLAGCDGLLWHWHWSDPPSATAARALIPALSAVGFPVFPDWHTCRHLDDKLLQTRLLKAHGLPLVPTRVFVRREDAVAWLSEARFPLVFKLRCGAASTNVWKVPDRRQGLRLVRRAFGRGFPRFRRLQNLRYAWRQLRRHPGPSSARILTEALALLVLRSRAERALGPEHGYAYFQPFLPDNSQPEDGV